MSMTRGPLSHNVSAEDAEPSFKYYVTLLHSQKSNTIDVIFTDRSLILFLFIVSVS